VFVTKAALQRSQLQCAAGCIAAVPSEPQQQVALLEAGSHGSLHSVLCHQRPVRLAVHSSLTNRRAFCGVCCLQVRNETEARGQLHCGQQDLRRALQQRN
jgi:hypothetical protein